MQRLLPVLLQSLEKKGVNAPYAEILRGFAQQTARAGQGSQAWLVVSVDISQTAETVRLTLKGLEDPQALLVLAPKPLHQWLVHDACRKAGWSMVLWPDWVHR